MKVVIQKVKSASVVVEGEIFVSIGPGLLCLIGLHENDSSADLDFVCKQITSCKIFKSEEKLWRKSVVQAGLEILLVSQFTLYGEIYKRGKMDFHHAMPADTARVKFNELVKKVKLKAGESKVKNGKFQAYMEVSLVNDGPITITFESHDHVPRSMEEEQIPSGQSQQKNPSLKPKSKMTEIHRSGEMISSKEKKCSHHIALNGKNFHGENLDELSISTLYYTLLENSGSQNISHKI
mmetsp:Transcript_1032/g.1461  ORF Transcript_1032/g.1461 Transcript_1032/m.1461 type:complete len:237 (-) Transcript_1032:95-805(-)|eukprot:CAMPEP_0117797520 /NCGR_PEP_ID=MMETSP0948-20121206/12579_1 /TAXON_ID=44440 /ORGANISM="Chattonella subsalsa, Strain CCMP2191" /LENGTH=236 /DNA_ID=CAMNT_0005628935 /DNA_START=75 /DNA_END=785 /DNA_ORIENTATION=-